MCLATDSQLNPPAYYSSSHLSFLLLGCTAFQLAIAVGCVWNLGSLKAGTAAAAGDFQYLDTHI